MKLAAFFLVVSLLPVAALALTEIRETNRRIFDDGTALLAARAEQIVAEIDAFQLGYQRAAARLASGAKVIELLTATSDEARELADPLMSRLRVNLTVDPAIRGIAVIGTDLRVLATTEPALQQRSLAQRGFARETLQGSAVISDVFVAEHEVGDVATIAYLCPVRATNGAVIGAVAFWVRADALWDLAQRATGLAGAGSFAVVFDHDGIRLAHTTNRDLVFHPGGPLAPEVIERLAIEHRFGPRTRELLGDVRPFHEPFTRARAAVLDPALFEGVAWADRKPHYGVGRRLAAVPWTVFYLVPEATLSAPVELAGRRHLVFALLVGVTALIAAGGLARVIATPLARLTAATRRLARGDLAVRVEPGRDEFGALGAAFNAMANQLHQSRTGLEATVAERTAALRDANRALREREHKLVASEQRYRDLYENSPDMYLTADPATRRIIDCNHTLCARLGYQRDDLLGRPLEIVYHPDHLATLPLRGVLEDLQREITDAERVLRCKDGRRIDASLSLRAVHDRDRRIVEVRAVWRDITSRKQADSDQQFQLGLADVMRTSTDASNVLHTVCTQLATYLDASRCLFAEVDLVHDTAMIHRDHHGDQSSVSGVLPLTHFGRAAADESRRGLTVVVEDSASDPRTAASHEAAFEPIGVRALVSVPLLRDGAWATTLVVTSAEPRRWQDHEIALVKLVAERAWSWVEHLRLLVELREQTVREAEQVLESRLLRTRQGELARSLKEREVLLQEIHHRVKNNLQVISSLINMQTRTLEAGASRDALEQCQTRVLAIALIHEKLYQSKDYAEVHFADYARSLVASVFHALGVSQTDVTLELAIEDIPLGIDRAIPCGLVLNELVTNALKHAFPSGRQGTIRVSLSKRDDGRICLRVADDGNGVPPGFEIHRATSMGLQLVCTLAEQLEAELSVTGDGGTAFELAFAGSES